MTDREKTEVVSTPAHAPKEQCGSFATDFLQDPATLKQDLQLANRMARSPRRWPQLNPKRKRHLISRLVQIANKRIVSVSTKDGPCPDESEADKNAMKAIQILSILEGQCQKDEHHQDDMERPASGTTINVDNRKVTILRIPDNGRGPAIEQQ